jgi:hypothetical protein
VLPAIITVFKDEEAIAAIKSNGQGSFSVVVPHTGIYYLVTSAPGFRPDTQTIHIEELGQQYILNFKSKHGLIPNTLDIWYLLDCAALWKYPQPDSEINLDMWRLLDVAAAWKYPVTIPPAPAMPAGWQELPLEQRNDNKINFYFPGEWITMTSQPLPTVILCLDPTFFPNCELRVFDVPAGTTNAQFRNIIKAKYPSSAGGEYDNFTVIEEGNITLDTGVQTVYMIYKGTRMGYGSQALAVFLVDGPRGFVLSGGDYPVTFSDSKELLTQIVETLHFIP